MADAITLRETELIEQRAQFEEIRRGLLVQAATPGNLDAIDSRGSGHMQGEVMGSQRLEQVQAAIDDINKQLAVLCVSSTGQSAVLTQTIGSDLSEYNGDPPDNTIDTSYYP